jgi:GMP synthase-like glutamine amidotransferase
MRPVVIFRFVLHEGPGYLATFLDEQNIPFELVKIDQGDALPISMDAYSGMVLMGGPMSIHDDLPWITPVINLILKAKVADLPLLGHCLGGQLISKALGADITKTTIKEIGWGQVIVSDNATAKDWFGAIETFNAFHWHGETFSLPLGAQRILSSHYCKNQAYAIGKHLVFQTHIEVTSDMVKNWCEVGAAELMASANSPGVQLAEVMQEDLQLHCLFLNKVAKQVYSRWALKLGA